MVALSVGDRNLPSDRTGKLRYRRKLPERERPATSSAAFPRDHFLPFSERAFFLRPATVLRPPTVLRPATVALLDAVMSAAASRASLSARNLAVFSLTARRA